MGLFLGRGRQEEELCAAEGPEGPERAEQTDRQHGAGVQPGLEGRLGQPPANESWGM